MHPAVPFSGILVRLTPASQVRSISVYDQPFKRSAMDFSRIGLDQVAISNERSRLVVASPERINPAEVNRVSEGIQTANVQDSEADTLALALDALSAYNRRIAFPAAFRLDHDGPADPANADGLATHELRFVPNVPALPDVPPDRSTSAGRGLREREAGA